MGRDYFPCTSLVAFCSVAQVTAYGCRCCISIERVSPKGYIENEPKMAEDWYIKILEDISKGVSPVNGNPLPTYHRDIHCIPDDRIYIYCEQLIDDKYIDGG